MYVPVCVFLCLRVLKGIVGMKVNLLTCFSEIVVVNVYKWVCVCCLSPRLRLLLLLGCVCVCVYVYVNAVGLYYRIQTDPRVQRLLLLP